MTNLEKPLRFFSFVPTTLRFGFPDFTMDPKDVQLFFLIMDKNFEILSWKPSYNPTSASPIATAN